MLKFVFLISISLVLINAGQNEMNLNVGNKVGRTGGISNDEIPADSTIDSLLNKIKSQVLGNLTVNSNSLTPVSYKTQIVAGKNYFIKVDIGSGKYVHLRVHLDLSDNVSLAGISEVKTKDDPIDYFEPKN